MSLTEIAIATDRLGKVFDRTIAVENLNLSVRMNTITGLLGGNGAGKSTTLAMLLGLLTPTFGSISILGHDLPKKRSQVAALMNFSSPYVDLPNRLTINQNLIVYGHLYSVPNLSRRIAELVGLLQIEDLLHRRHGSLSAGQRTRASLAKSLLNKPQILLLDEPTASLDPETAEWVRRLLKEYQRTHRMTILMSSHNMYEVEEMCDAVIVMKKGKVAAEGAPFELLARFKRDTLEQVFLEIARGPV